MLSLTGRPPPILTTARGNKYYHSPHGGLPGMLAGHWETYKPWNGLAGPPILNFAVLFREPYWPAFERFSVKFWIHLRMWVRRTRQTVYSRALVRHHLPSILGKRRRG